MPDLISSAKLSAQDVTDPEKVDSSIVSIIPVSQVYMPYVRVSYGREDFRETSRMQFGRSPVTDGMYKVTSLFECLNMEWLTDIANELSANRLIRSVLITETYMVKKVKCLSALFKIQKCIRQTLSVIMNGSDCF